jgi:hypothetical protein
MNEQELYTYLVEVTGISDFVLELKPIYSKAYWGRYFPARKLIRIYQLDEERNPLPDTILVKEALHELAHHVQYYHVPDWERKPGIMHDSQFWEIYRGFLDTAFDRYVAFESVVLPEDEAGDMGMSVLQ